MWIDRRVTGIGLALVLCQATVVFRAQNRVDGLESAKTLKCTFPLLATGTWSKTGEPQGEVKASKLQLGFQNIDSQDGTADVTGSFGAPHIVVRYAGGYLHFMQVGSSGFLYTTTVYDKFASPGKLKAVHSRHEYTEVSLPGYTSRPEQYYGECEVGS